MARRVTFVIALGSFIGAITLTLGAVAPARATTTRVAGLGGGADYVTDESNVRRWYASLAWQPDLLLVEPGTLDLDAGSAGWDQRTSDRGGGLFVRANSSGSAGTFAAFFAAHPSDGTPGGGIAAQYGRAFGRLAAGVSLKATSSFTDSGSQRAIIWGEGDYYHEIGAGLRWLVADHAPIEVAGELVNSQFSYTYGTKNGSWRSFGLRARANVPCNATITLVPLVDYWRDDRPGYSDVTASTGWRDAWQIRTGVGAVATLSPSRTLVVSGEYRDGKEDFITSYYSSQYGMSERTYFAIHWRIGIEGQVRSWLQVRVGAEYRRIRESYFRWKGVAWDSILDATQGASIRVETPLTLGCTATAGDLFLDLALADGTPSSATFLRAENGLADNAHLMAATIGWKF